MKGTLLNNVSFTGTNVFYDPLSAGATYLDHRDDSLYGLGDPIGIVAGPFPLGVVPSRFFQFFDYYYH